MTVKVFVVLAALLAMPALFAGCGEVGGASDGEFSITNIVFCSAEPGGYMSYKEQAQATYRPGDVVWIYMNLNNHQFNPNKDGTSEIWFTQQLTIKSPDGQIVASEEVINEHKNLSKELDPRKVFLKNYINTKPGSTEGKYAVEITAVDKLSNRTTSVSTGFNLDR